MNSTFLKNNYTLLGGFDIDGNILETQSECYLIDRETWQEVTVLGHILDQNPFLLSWDNPKYRLHDDAEESFAQYRDSSIRLEHKWAEQLIGDVRDAIEKHCFSPSFSSFKDTFLIPARFFSIITARWHSAENLARAMQTISESVLTPQEKELQYRNIIRLWRLMGKKWELNKKMALDFYFQKIGMYYWVSSPQLCNMIWVNHELPSSIKKTHAMNHFINRTRKLIADNIPQLQSHSLSLWFSDDSLSNIYAMIDYFLNERKQNSLIYSEDKIHVYFTWKQEWFQEEKVPWGKIKRWESMTTIRI
jgi:hypothetical protein